MTLVAGTPSLIKLGGSRGAGLFAVVDECTAKELAGFHWFLDSGGYARRNRVLADGARSPRIISMHRQVLGLHADRGFPGDDVDHIDGDRLNNRRSNLRRVSRSQNNVNRHSFSGFIGVNRFHVETLRKRWRGYITKDGKQHCVGYFETAEEAALARDAKARELFGVHATLNFPERFI